MEAGAKFSFSPAVAILQSSSSQKTVATDRELAMTDIPILPDNPQLLLRHALRNDLKLFARKAWPGGGLEWNWHHDAIVYQLMRVLNGQTKRLIINLHPRSGKSNLANVIFPAFALGRRPDLRFIGVSYSLELSGKHARDCRSILEESWYREVFPRAMLSRSRSAAHDFETTRRGGRLSTSVGGSLTGRGGSIIIMDDVIKPDEVNSELARENLNEFYRSTLSSRLDDKRTGAIILLMQRLHQFDLTGMLTEKGGWEVLSLPVVAQQDALIPLTRGRVHHFRTGDLLHPEREPQAVLDQTKSEMGSAAYTAQYLQKPLPAEGNLFRAKWLRSFAADAVPAHGQILQSWDTGIKTGDRNSYSVCVTARLNGNDIYIINVWRGRLEFPDLERKVAELARIHQATTLLIEDRASGQQLIQNLLSKCPAGVPVPIARIPRGEKAVRATGVSSMVEAGQVFLPQEAGWLGEFLGELLAFPSGRFDDQVDAFSQLLDWVRERSMVQVPINAGPEEMTDGEPDADPFSGQWSSPADPWGAY